MVGKPGASATGRVLVASEPARVLVSGEERPKKRLRDPEATSANLFVVVGAAFAMIGLVDLGLLWTPVRIGTPGWEFATVSRTFTNVPMTAFGLVLVTYGLIRHPARRPAWTRGAAVVFGVLALVLVAMGLLYALAVPAVINQAGPEAMEALKRAIIKNGIEIVVYPVVFGLVSIMLWRAAADTN